MQHLLCPAFPQVPQYVSKTSHCLAKRMGLCRSLVYWQTQLNCIVVNCYVYVLLYYVNLLSLVSILTLLCLKFWNNSCVISLGSVVGGVNGFEGDGIIMEQLLFSNQHFLQFPFLYWWESHWVILILLPYTIMYLMKLSFLKECWCYLSTFDYSQTVR